MKRFTISVLTVSVFFLGLGALVEKSLAGFRSDEKALDLVRKARAAIGGEAAIATVTSMRITGRTTKTLKMTSGDRTDVGETEIAMMLPDRLMKSMKLGSGDGHGAGGEVYRIVEKQVEVAGKGDHKAKVDVTVDGADAKGEVRRIVIKKDDGTVQELTGAEADKMIAAHGAAGGEQKVIVRKADGPDAKIVVAEGGKVATTGGEPGVATFTTKDGKTFAIARADVGSYSAHSAPMKHNEMLRLTLSLLLSAPKGIDIEYTYGGTGDVDGRNCSIVVASFGGQSFRLFLDSTSNLPAAIAYKAIPEPHIAKFTSEKKSDPDGGSDVLVFKKAAGPIEPVEVMVKFSDHRAVNGVQLPFKWTRVGGGDEIFDVTAYEINPANIAERFKDQTMMVKIRKADAPH